MLIRCHVSVLHDSYAKSRGVFILVVEDGQADRSWYKWFESELAAGRKAKSMRLASATQGRRRRDGAFSSERYLLHKQIVMDSDSIDLLWNRGRPDQSQMFYAVRFKQKRLAAQNSM
jgi:hypothetical protein